MAHNNSLSILLVEDNETDYESVKRELGSGDQVRGLRGYQLTWAKTIAEAKEKLSESHYDTVLLDLSLPDSVGMSGISQISLVSPLTPIVVLTGLDDEETALKALSQGAQDYLVKGQKNNTVKRTIWHSIHRQEIMGELKKARVDALKASEAKSNFLASMSHELRTPLTAILGFSDILSDNSLSISERQEAIATVTRNAEHLLQIINEILDLSKVEAGSMEMEVIEVNLEEVLRSAWALLKLKCKEKKLDYSIVCDSLLPSVVRTDGLRLKQVLFNLISNATKFTDHGYVRLHVSYDPDSERLMFDVEDTGTGIPADKIEQVFEAFGQADCSITRKYGGTGLGLSISRKFAQLLGGDIELTSSVGEGSTFHFSIHPEIVDLSNPISEFNFSDVDSEQEVSSKIVSLKGRVLLVEDCVDNQALISHHLNKAGVDFELAEHGGIALEMVNNSDFDLILMDMQMPEVDGYSATKILRNQGHTLPIVALTASAMQEHLSKCLESGCDEYMSKPFRPNELYGLLDKYLSINSEAKSGDDQSKEKSTVSPELESIVNGFVERLPARHQEISEALISDDLKRVALLAHSLAGAGMFGFSKLGEIGKGLEQASTREDSDNIEKYKSLLLEEIEHICIEHNR